LLQVDRNIEMVDHDKVESIPTWSTKHFIAFF
jgi:hypothetical protein